MEQVRPWCGQPSDRGRLKNRNNSLIYGQFHPTLKEFTISQLLKKPTLDKEELSNYGPISNLSLISKIIERSNRPRKGYLIE